MPAARHPYAELTPDRVLDAVDSAGWRSDGRLFTLNSYENRVYQVGLEDGASVVAKFYRPARWRTTSRCISPSRSRSSFRGSRTAARAISHSCSPRSTA